jgi:2-oxoglutarate ferredoxin oxidoreductase subunit beta
MQTLIEELIIAPHERSGKRFDEPHGETPVCEMKDFKSPLEVRWCAGCGDYAVLAQVQKILPELGMPRENIAFISGIGCSSRFPYYMNTFGFHTIHGRASAVASGLKIARPDLSVWVVTGDGDALSIGGNHNIHLFRRNLDVNVLMLNNEIYALTKGQFSPTSHRGQITKSSPLGALEQPFNPPTLALGAGATFIARTIDRDLPHLRSTLLRAARHKGTSFVEIYQNCVVFNDGAFERFTDKSTKDVEFLNVEHGKPLVFGWEREWGVRLDGLRPEIISLGADSRFSLNDALVYDETDATMAHIVVGLTNKEGFPRPFGVFRAVSEPTFDEQIRAAQEQKIHEAGEGNLADLLTGRDSWIVA